MITTSIKSDSLPEILKPQIIQTPVHRLRNRRKEQYSHAQAQPKVRARDSFSIKK